MTDNTVPAWATALVETVNNLRAEMNAHFDQVDHRLERLELATDRMTAAVDELDAQLAAVETRMSLRDGPQT